MWRDLVVPGPDANVLARFADVVAMRPDQPAVVSHGRSVSFLGLSQRAAELAERIRDGLTAQSGGEDDPVAVLADQGIATVTAMLAVLMVARPVALLDPLLPAERLRLLLRRAGARLLLVGPQPTDALDELFAVDPPDVMRLPIDAGLDPYPGTGQATRAGDTAGSVRTPVPEASLTDPASIVFTSGSTGTNKGVVLTHRTILAGAYISRRGFGLGPGDRVAFVLPHAFSAGQEVAFMALLNGATLHALDPRTAGIRSVESWLLDQRITTLHCTPSLLRAVVGALSPGQVLGDVRLVTTCGEAVYGSDIAALRPHLRPDAVFTSWLGASEVGQLAFYDVPGDVAVPKGIVPVGPPVPLKEVSILDDDGEQVAAGQVGAVHVTSAYLSGGYWRDPERTAERFSVLPDGRVRYAMGDRGWCDESGALNLVGRADDAVKIRGYLVEPSEVEGALLRLDGVAQAVVRGRSIAPAADPAESEDAPPEVQLTAWVVPAPGPAPSAAHLRRQLRVTLPDWAVPSDVVLIPAIPLTERGKLDVAALPAPPPRSPARTPLSGTQAVVGRIWAELLGLDGVDPDEEFRQLGGDSLATEEMLVRVREQLGAELTLSDLAEHPTLEAFSGLAESRRRSSRRRDAQWSPTMVRLRAEGAGIPVFCFAGAATHGITFTGLAAGLHGHRVYAFHVSGLAARGPIDWTLRANARRHVRDIVKVSPEGPVVVVGHSLGGLVALEVAQQLAQQGRSVPLVVILDTFLPPRHGGHVGNWGRKGVGPVKDYTGSAPQATERERSSAWRLLLRTARVQDRRTLRRRLMLPAAGFVRWNAQITEEVFWQHAFLLSRTARLTPWAGRALVVHTEENPDDLSDWDSVLIGPHEFRFMPGDHDGMLRPPYVDGLTKLLRQAIDDVVEGPQPTPVQ